MFIITITTQTLQHFHTLTHFHTLFKKHQQYIKITSQPTHTITHLISQLHPLHNILRTDFLLLPKKLTRPTISHLHTPIHHKQLHNQNTRSYRIHILRHALHFKTQPIINTLTLSPTITTIQQIRLHPITHKRRQTINLHS